MVKKIERKASKRGLGYMPSPHVYDFIKDMEGNLPRQAEMGIFRGGKFYLFNGPAGHTLIGYGHKLTRQEIASGRFREGISAKEADDLLRADVQKAAVIAERHFGEDGWKEMGQAQKDAALDHVYTLGAKGMRGFPRWSHALRTGDWQGVKREAKRFYKDSRSRNWVEMSRRNMAYERTFVSPNLAASPPEPVLVVRKAEPLVERTPREKVEKGAVGRRAR
jgi:GH24 family phage-related lysozyme (muramidase)